MTTPDQPERQRKYPPPAPMSPQQPPPNYQQPPMYSTPPPQQQPMYSPPPQQPWAPPPATGMPQTYLVLNIVALLFSCLFGAIGLFFSNQVTQKWNAGDHEGARKASTTAMIMGIIGIVLGGIVLIATLAAGGY